MLVIYYVYFNIAIQALAILTFFLLAAQGSAESPKHGKAVLTYIVQAIFALPIWGRVLGWW